MAESDQGISPIKQPQADKAVEPSSESFTLEGKTYQEARGILEQAGCKTRDAWGTTLTYRGSIYEGSWAARLIEPRPEPFTKRLLPVLGVVSTNTQEQTGPYLNIKAFTASQQGGTFGEPLSLRFHAGLSEHQRLYGVIVEALTHGGHEDAIRDLLTGNFDIQDRAMAEEIYERTKIRSEVVGDNNLRYAGINANTLHQMEALGLTVESTIDQAKRAIAWVQKNFPGASEHHIARYFIPDITANPVQYGGTYYASGSHRVESVYNMPSEVQVNLDSGFTPGYPRSTTAFLEESNYPVEASTTPVPQLEPPRNN